MALALADLVDDDVEDGTEGELTEQRRREGRGARAYLTQPLDTG